MFAICSGRPQALRRRTYLASSKHRKIWCARLSKNALGKRLPCKPPGHCAHVAKVAEAWLQCHPHCCVGTHRKHRRPRKNLAINDETPCIQGRSGPPTYSWRDGFCPARDAAKKILPQTDPTNWCIPQNMVRELPHKTEELCKS